MSDLRDLPDLARDVRERVVVPPYDEVSRRVRARRLRGAAGSVAAAVLVVGGVAVVAERRDDHRSPAPADDRPVRLGPAPADRRVAVARRSSTAPTRASVRGRPGTDDGADRRGLACPGASGARRSRWSIREADGTVHGRRLDEPVDADARPRRLGGVPRAARAWFIGSDGELDRPRRTPGRHARSQPGDVFVRGQYGDNGCTRPTTEAWPRSSTGSGDIGRRLRHSRRRPRDLSTATDGERLDHDRGRSGPRASRATPASWLGGATTVDRGRAGRRARRRHPDDRAGDARRQALGSCRA